MDSFFTDHADLQVRLQSLEPVAYQRSRNFTQGAVTRLGPMITHGILDTRQIALAVLERHSLTTCEGFFFQLAWREFFHRTWQARGSDIFDNLRFEQHGNRVENLPAAILDGQTGIHAIDHALESLHTKGYMHNHERLWCASVVCHISKTDWRSGARWMYYHLLDGDLASNSLSWQWVAGTSRQKSYFANQDNLNKYSGFNQKGTFLDVPHECLENLEIPAVLQTRRALDLVPSLPKSTLKEPVKSEEQVFLYHPFSLDPTWHAGEEGRRILLIEPKIFEAFPMSPLRWEFVRYWAETIPGLEWFVGNWEGLFPQELEKRQIHYREYPLFRHWQGICEPRAWLASRVEGLFPSFFSFWKHAQRALYEEFR